MKMLKPLYYWDLQLLKEHMLEMGYEMKFLGTPRTFHFAACDSTDNLSTASRNIIEKYLTESGADGGYVEKPDSVHGYSYVDYSNESVNMTIVPFKLKRNSSP